MQGLPAILAKKGCAEMPRKNKTDVVILLTTGRDARGATGYAARLPIETKLINEGENGGGLRLRPHLAAPPFKFVCAQSRLNRDNALLLIRPPFAEQDTTEIQDHEGHG